MCAACALAARPMRRGRWWREFFPTLEPAQNRYTVIAGKKCGKAVDRNRLKRLTREALRGFHPHLKRGYDVAIIVRGDLTELPSLIVAQTVLERIFGKASLIDARPRYILHRRPGDPIVSGWYLPRTNRNPGGGG